MVLSSRTDPRRRASRRMPVGRVGGDQLEDRHRPVDVDHGHPGDVADPAGVGGGAGRPGGHDEAMEGPPAVPQVGHPSIGHDPPGRQHDQVVAEPLDHVELVAGEQHRHAARGLLPQHGHHVVHGDRVEAGERLVEDQRVRLVHQRGRDLDALLVAQRQLLQRSSARSAMPEPVEQARRCSRRAVAAASPCSRPR